MLKPQLHIVIAMLIMLSAGCAGSTVPPTGPGDGTSDIEELQFDFVTDPGSSVDADEIDGELIDVDDALNARVPSALPSGFVGRQGMYFSPPTPPGAGFSGHLTVRLTAGNPTPNEYNGVLLFLFYIDPATLIATQLDSARGTAGNWVTFEVTALGHMVVAENTEIPRPDNAFTVSAYADLALTETGVLINFWALAENGVEPITYTWDLADGTQLNGAQVSHAYNQAGTYSVVLAATDAAGASAPSSSTPIVITAAPTPLQSVEVAVTPDASNDLHFLYLATIQGGTAPFTYSWDFDGDETIDSVSPPIVEHTFDAPGFYQGTLLVTDANSEIATAQFASDAIRLTLASDTLTGQAPHQCAFTIEALTLTTEHTLTVYFGNGNSLLDPPAVFGYTYNNTGTYIAYAEAAVTINEEQYTTRSNELDIEVTQPPAPQRPILQLTQPILPPTQGPFEVYGYNFGNSPEGCSITVDNTELEILSWTNTRIRVLAPDPPLPAIGMLQVSSIAGTSNSIALTFNNDEIPANIQNVIPFDSPPANRVLVLGHGFGAQAVPVRLEGVDCTVEAWNPSAVLALLPLGAGSGDADLTLHLANGNVTFNVQLTPSPTSNPVLSDIEPDVQEIGVDGTVALTGFGFGNGNGGLVFGDGITFPITEWSDTTITIGDPLLSVDYWLVVVDRQRVSNQLPIAYIRRPIIESLNPVEAVAGESVDITGRNFGGRILGDEVTLNDQAVPVEMWTDTVIRFTVPANAQNGDVVVAKKLLSNSVPLTVIPPAPGKPEGDQI